jgi:hypothetical protein
LQSLSFVFFAPFDINLEVFMKTTVVVFAALLALGSGLSAQTLDYRVMVHQASNIHFSVSNFGILGSQDGFYDDPDYPGITPGAEFPARSGINYLFFGAIWIGAVVDTIDDQGNPALDTLVSVGNDSWWGSIFELNPPPVGYPSMWRDRIVADEEIFAVYTDTVVDPQYVNPDPNDGRMHLPLGLKVTQHSLCWGTPGYDEFFIIEFALENIRNRDIHDAWLGILYDGDVFHNSESPYGNEQGAQDDLCGFLPSTGPGLAWIADNDGQPMESTFVYTERSPRGVMGMMLAGSTEPTVTTNFNWWISNTDSLRDWGPQRQSNFDRWGRFPCGGLGTPCGDVAKYRVMSNGEHDYDQAYTNIDLTDQGWIQRPFVAPEVANGYDTRFLISFGPFQIGIGEIETVTVALLGGRNLHNDSLNYEHNLRYMTWDTLSIAQYYANLDFTDFLAKGDSALSFVARHFANIPVGPPADFRVSSWGENHLDLIWNRTWYDYLQEYRIYRGTQPGVYEPVPITPGNFTDTVFIDMAVANNTTYYYVITTVKENGIEGGRSPEVSQNTGMPQRPTGLSVVATNNAAELTWSANPDTDIAGYIIYHGLHGDELLIVDSTANLQYTDANLMNGVEYDFAIQAYDVYGNVSPQSERAYGLPMGLDGGILIVNATRAGSINPDFDSMMAFYIRAFDGLWYNIVTEPPPSLPMLSNYSTVIWVKDLASERFGPDQTTKGLLSLYLDNGGKLIFAGTRTLIGPNNIYGTIEYHPGDFEYAYLNLSALEYPELFTNTEFIGGRAIDLGFEDFAVDTARANRILFPDGDNDGRLFGMGAVIPNDTAEVIYEYSAVNPDTSRFHGRPLAIVHDTDSVTTAYLEFPLYYAEEPSSRLIIRELLRRFGEQVGIEEDDPAVPRKFALLQNYPNPFNAGTTISFDLPSTRHATLTVYNLLGQRIASLVDAELPAGRHTVTLDAAALSSGIYFARLESADSRATIRMVLMK